MPRITVLPHADLCPDGTGFDLPRGAMLCEGLLAHGIAIEHACEMVGACATCHVFVRRGGEGLKPPGDDESDELDNAWGVAPASRLACCVRLGQGDLTIELPRHTRNHSRER